MVAGYLLLTLAALVVTALASPARRLRLFVALFALGWTVGHFNTLIEAVAFNVMSVGQVLPILGGSAVAFAVLTGLAVLIAGKWWRDDGAPPVRPQVTPLRLVGVILGYELLYFGAGSLAFPYIADFYNARALPPFWLVASLQVPRALIFVAAAWPWLRTGPRAAPWVLGIAFSLIGGIAPLLPDNPYMPADIRLVHGIEVGISNFLFGVLVGWLLRPKA